jgi:polysaccharide export outer membrane protein
MLGNAVTASSLLAPKRAPRPRARRRPALIGAAWLLCAGLLAACSNQRTVANDPSLQPGSPNPADNSLYLIGPGDTLSVFVYRSPELSQEVPVRPDGRISVPLIEDVTASGKTAMQLAREIEDRLKKYVKDPSVTVTVRSFVGPLDRQVRVIGEAADPAALAYREHMTLLDVMIATKGLTKFAAGNRAVIVRTYGGKQQSINVRLSDLVKDGDISQNIEMMPGDTLIIPQTWF